MLESLIARARFYDITGYWIPGNLALGVIWLYARVFGWAESADKVISFIGDHWLSSTILVFVVGGYAVGHLVNSISKLLIEKIVFAIPYKKNADWLKRIQEKNEGGAPGHNDYRRPYAVCARNCEKQLCRRHRIFGERGCLRKDLHGDACDDCCNSGQAVDVQ